MLLIVLALVCLTASFNSDAVAEWYWDYIYNAKVASARQLLKQDLVYSHAVIERNPTWEPGGSITFRIQTSSGPVTVNYQPRKEEYAYVRRALRGGQFGIYHRKLVPRQCVLASTWNEAKAILRRPKPARIPGDRISSYLNLFGKALALILFLVGITQVSKRPY